MINLLNYVINNEGKCIDKWMHYFPVYEKHFSQFIGKKVLMIEVGVYKGGSLQMWSDYLGPNATIVGLDIDPGCKNLIFNNSNIHVRIGNQTDHTFLQNILDEFGPPDIVLDDGSHLQSDITKTFEFIYPKMKEQTIYMVEDLQTSYWEEYEGGVDSKSFINKSKEFIDFLNAHNSRGKISPNYFTDQTFCMNVYDSIICFEKMSIKDKSRITTGSC